MRLFVTLFKIFKRKPVIAVTENANASLEASPQLKKIEADKEAMAICLDNSCNTIKILEIDCETSDGFVHIWNMDYFGPCSISPSGEYLITWLDSYQAETGIHGGCRDSGDGQYLLINIRSKKIVVKGQLQRPNNAHVADNGAFSIEDWHFGRELSGDFFVFSQTGEVLIKKTFEANLYDSFISPNGKLAICQTANAPSDHGNLLTAFSLENKTELFSVINKHAWGNGYIINEEAHLFGIQEDDVGTFYYDDTGTLFEAKKHLFARLASSNIHYSMQAAKEIITTNGSSNEHIQLALVKCTLALNNDVYQDKAGLLKLQGLAYEALGDPQAALSAFENALCLNAKIGVKRKVAALTKTLDQNK